MATDNWWDSLPGHVPMDLPSRSTVPNTGSLPTGGSGSPLDKSSQVPWGQILGTGATLATSALAGDSGSITPDVRGIQREAGQQLHQGKALFDKGTSDMAPVIEYFKKLFSGNAADAQAATAPQRSRVIDQYDAARRSAGQFTPRGGGQASTQMESRAKEAEQLGSIVSSARSDASTALASIGQNEQQAGLSAEEQAQQQLAQVLGPLLNQQGADTASTIQTYAGLAAMVAAFL